MFLFESFVYIFICIYFWKLSDEWKILQLPNLLFSTLGIIFLFVMPESPRYLVAKRRFEDARRVFMWIGIKNGLTLTEIEIKLDAIKFDDEHQVVKKKHKMIEQPDQPKK